MEDEKIQRKKITYYNNFEKERIITDFKKLNDKKMYTRANEISELIYNVENLMFIQKGKFLKKWKLDGYGSNYYYELKKKKVKREK